MSSVERSFYDRMHKQVISTQAQHLASQKKRRKPGSSHNPARSVALFFSHFIFLLESVKAASVCRRDSSYLFAGAQKLLVQSLYETLNFMIV